MIRSRRKAILQMMLAAFLWSIGGVAIKIVTGNPLAIAGVQSGIASVVILFYVGFKFEKIDRYILIGTLCYSFTSIGFVCANKLTSSANAIFLQFTAPVWVVVFSYFFLKARVTLSDIVTIIALLIGMFLFFFEKMSGGMLVGNLIAVMTGISFAGFIVNLKLYYGGKSIYPILYGNILNLFIGIPFMSSSLTLPLSILGLIVLGLFQVGISYILYSKAIEHLTAIDGILIPLIEPLLNPVWVYLAVGESISSWALIGGAVILLSVVSRDIYNTRFTTSSNVT